jgi:hypothetical protein
VHHCGVDQSTGYFAKCGADDSIIITGTRTGLSEVGHWPTSARTQEQFSVLAVVGYSTKGALMHAADRFLKFSTECQLMAERAPQRENKRAWNRLAERWRRCAKLTEQLDVDLRSSELRRKQKYLKIVTH